VGKATLGIGRSASVKSIGKPVANTPVSIDMLETAEQVMEDTITKTDTSPAEVIREVIVEKIIEVEKPVEVIKEIMTVEYRPVEVIKEVIVEKPVEVIKEIIVEKEKILRIPDLAEIKSLRMELERTQTKVRLLSMALAASLFLTFIVGVV
jgi:hypothetical protein